MYQLTLDGVSAKITELLTECQLRLCVDWVVVEMLIIDTLTPHA